MAVSATYRAYVLEQLGRNTRGLRARNLFGGVGIYAGEFFFALMDDDTLYLKVDESNRPDFEAIGMGPFRPFGEGGEVMQYYEVSAEILEDPDLLAGWTEKAIAVARRARKKPK